MITEREFKSIIGNLERMRIEHDNMHDTLLRIASLGDARPDEPCSAELARQALKCLESTKRTFEELLSAQAAMSAEVIEAIARLKGIGR